MASNDNLSRTTLWQAHNNAGARMVDFAGWDMPIQYSSGIVAEVAAVRGQAGMFDVSHMGRVEFSGAQAQQFLDFILGANVERLKIGGAKYTLLCNDGGGIIDDCIIYKLAEEHFMLVINAARMQPDLEWIEKQRAKFSGVQMKDVTADIAMMAVQGPRAVAIVDQMSGGAAADVARFQTARVDLAGASTLIARTGYTGEDGFELMPPAAEAAAVWDALAAQGVAPCGLGARDVLRLEAGLMLYGNDITTDNNPYEAALGWTISLKKEADYIARDALAAIKEKGSARKIGGMRMVDGGVPRSGMKLLDAAGAQVGSVTSGTFSPTLNVGIAMGYISAEAGEPGTRLSVDVRGTLKPLEVVKLPFYKPSAE